MLAFQSVSHQHQYWSLHCQSRSISGPKCTCWPKPPNFGEYELFSIDFSIWSSSFPNIYNNGELIRRENDHLPKLFDNCYSSVFKWFKSKAYTYLSYRDYTLLKLHKWEFLILLSSGCISYSSNNIKPISIFYLSSSNAALMPNEPIYPCDKEGRNAF